MSRGAIKSQGSSGNSEGGAGSVVRSVWELCALLPRPCSLHLFHLAVPELYHFIITQYPREHNVFWSSVSRSRKSIKPKEGVGSLVPPVSSWSVRSTGENLDLLAVGI